MNKKKIPRVFCWTKMGDEAGQPIHAIISRKEAERERGQGVFFWGIGTALGQRIWAFIDYTRRPVVMFSPMKAKPRPVDVSPKEVFVWTAYLDRHGCKHPIPDHALVISRGAVSDSRKKQQYALVCKKKTPLLNETWPTLDWNALGNFDGDSKLGFSQVTAVVETRTRKNQCSLRYDVLFGAELVPPYYVTLADPAAFPKTLLTKMNSESPFGTVK